MNTPWSRVLAELSEQRPTRDWMKKTGKTSLHKNDIVSGLSAFIRSLVSGGSRFDRYQFLGDSSALTASEVRGWEVFSGKARCVRCHQVGIRSARFADSAYHALGTGYGERGYDDSGRGKITGSAADIGKFRTPSLRNISKTSPYMHNGHLDNLAQVLRFYDFGGEPGALNQDTLVRPLDLTEGEIRDIIAFLESLDSPVRQYYPWGWSKGGGGE